MKTKTSLICLFLILSHLISTAQKENNIWAFGQSGVGIDFNTGSPLPIITSISGIESVATICDTKGNLLFYSNGINIWDKTHALMPNGMGLLGTATTSSTQGTAIVPVFGSPDLYLLFVVSEQDVARKGYLRYSVIDMSLNGGKGDIVSGKKNILLDSNMSEKMITAPACNGVWVITHHKDSATFYSYKINSGAVIEPPVISKTSGVNIPDTYFVGQIKLSPDLSKIALGNISLTSKYSKTEIFDFDWKSGLISGYYPIDSSKSAYGFEFSPDNSKLYVIESLHHIDQYDLSLLPDTSAVLASKYNLGFTGLPVGIRRGPDGKIYIKRRIKGDYVSVIENPNIAGPGCNVQLDLAAIKFSIPSDFLSFGNPVSIPFMISDSILVRYTDTSVCNGSSMEFLGDNNFDAYLWNDGDTSRNRSITTAGNYSLKSVKGCKVKIDSIKLSVKPTESITKVTDTVVCFQEKLELKGSGGYTHFLWNDGSTSTDKIFSSDTKAWLLSTHKDCKKRTDTFNIKMVNFKVNIPDTFICKDQTIRLDATTLKASQYLWQDGSAASSFYANKPGFYWVKINVEGCTLTEDINITANPDTIELGSDTTLCSGEKLLLKIVVDHADIRWSNGSQNQEITIDKSGNYSVEVNKNGCISKDEINISYKACRNCIAIPNAFTPNNDGLNDIFRVKTFCDYLRFELMIVNRSGETIFTGTDPFTAWKGDFKNKELSPGVYFYFIKVKFDYLGAKEEIYKGDITLIR